jgi:hypothetical protein
LTDVEALSSGPNDADASSLHLGAGEAVEVNHLVPSYSSAFAKLQRSKLLANPKGAMSASGSVVEFTEEAEKAGEIEIEVTGEDEAGSGVDGIVGSWQKPGMEERDLLASPIDLGVAEVPLHARRTSGMRAVMLQVDKRGSAAVMSEQLDDLEKRTSSFLTCPPASGYANANDPVQSCASFLRARSESPHQECSRPAWPPRWPTSSSPVTTTSILTPGCPDPLHLHLPRASDPILSKSRAKSPLLPPHQRLSKPLVSRIPSRLRLTNHSLLLSPSPGRQCLSPTSVRPGAPHRSRSISRMPPALSPRRPPYPRKHFPG